MSVPRKSSEAWNSRSTNSLPSVSTTTINTTINRMSEIAISRSLRSRRSSDGSRKSGRSSPVIEHMTLSKSQQSPIDKHADGYAKKNPHEEDLQGTHTVALPTGPGYAVTVTASVA